MKSFKQFLLEGIDPRTPIAVINMKTNEIVWTGTYEQRQTARRVIDRRDNKYGGYIHRMIFPDGMDPILEYRHNLADGTSAPSIQVHNGKNPNRIDKKNLHTIGPYQHKDKKMHKPGAIFIGGELMSVLSDYNLEFKNGETHQIKNSPHAIQMYVNKMGQETGRIIKNK